MIKFILQGYRPIPGTFLHFHLGSDLSREKSCQARDSNVYSSLTIEDGFSYASFEAVGYDFNTIELSQLVRRVPFFDSKIFCSHALEWSECISRRLVYTWSIVGARERERGHLSL
ncbi:hypothetical protein Bca52824_073665 [Brassica carinata]|uniref:Uncharacterized protein n=1 Tax=Brassica carinata TaxID=52824 RepID=A0A8X7U873_BRACI|nr:hypothetical protein Bca52824_073665 [Brassica carinata]